MSALKTLLQITLAGLMLVGAPAWADTVLIWGDSLSAGYGLQIQQAWPSLLEKRIADAKLPHKVVNASISGETTSGGRSRLPTALQTHKPAVVIIELGANDGLLIVEVRDQWLVLGVTSQHVNLLSTLQKPVDAQATQADLPPFADWLSRALQKRTGNQPAVPEQT